MRARRSAVAAGRPVTTWWSVPAVSTGLLGPGSGTFACEIGIGDARLWLFEPGAAFSLGALAPWGAAASAIALPWAASIAAAAATLPLAGYAGIGRGRFPAGALLRSNTRDLDNGVLGATAKEAATLSFIEHDEFDFIEPCSEFG